MPPKSRSKTPPAPTLEEVLAQLDNAPPLKLLEIAETLHPNDVPSAHKRESGVSEDSDQAADTNPAALEADLAHYKELFTKLRLSYTEQSTKEKYLRAITSQTPPLISPAENSAKESEILLTKAALKNQKLEIASILKDLETKGRELAQRYESVEAKRKLVKGLPADIQILKESIETLKTAQVPSNNNPELNLPLPATESLLSSRTSELEALNAELATLQARIPTKAQELDKLERDLRPLEIQKQGVVAAAVEARRRREEGGGLGDELEERGRWLRASEGALKEMLGVEG